MMGNQGADRQTDRQTGHDPLINLRKYLYARKSKFIKYLMIRWFQCSIYSRLRGRI